MSDTDATAVHLANESGDHVVGIEKLRVLIIEDEKTWFAQGLEIDHLAQGSSIDEAKSNFETGLLATIHENLRIFGTIESVLNPAPLDIWKERLRRDAVAKRLSHVSIHQIDTTQDVRDLLPFQGIDYLKVEAHA